VSDSDDRPQRFRQGKEILTALIGVLGTIVGFYFGHTADAPLSELNLAPFVVSEESRAPGEPFKITTFVTSGKAPYTYRVDFTPNSVPAIVDVKSPDGWINIEGTVPPREKLKDAKNISFVLTVVDSEGRKFKYDSAEQGKQVHLKLENKETTTAKGSGSKPEGKPAQ
jgi:hypothetical protein